MAAINKTSKYDADPHMAEVYDGDWATHGFVTEHAMEHDDRTTYWARRE